LDGGVEPGRSVEFVETVDNIRNTWSSVIAELFQTLREIMEPINKSGKNFLLVLHAFAIS
jgi:hypothetical protein